MEHVPSKNNIGLEEIKVEAVANARNSKLRVRFEVFLNLLIMADTSYSL